MTLFNGSIPRRKRHELMGVLSLQQAGDDTISSDTDSALGNTVGQESDVDDRQQAAQVVVPHTLSLLLLRMPHVELLAPSFSFLRFDR